MVTFWEKLLTRLTKCSLMYFAVTANTICNFSFSFEGMIWVLIASVPDLCIFLLLSRCCNQY